MTHEEAVEQQEMIDLFTHEYLAARRALGHAREKLTSYLIKVCGYREGDIVRITRPQRKHKLNENLEVVETKELDPQVIEAKVGRVVAHMNSQTAAKEPCYVTVYFWPRMATKKPQYSQRKEFTANDGDVIEIIKKGQIKL